MTELMTSRQTHLVFFLGNLRKQDGTRLKVFSTRSKQHVLMFPRSDSGQLLEDFASVQITDLHPEVRVWLGC